MTKQWRLIASCAMLGVLVTGLIVAYLLLFAMFDVRLYTVFVVLCPPSVLSIPLSDLMKDRAGFYVVWCFIGLANAGLYATIGAAVAGQLWKPEK